MKKSILIFLLINCFITVSAQKRVGINTINPKAALHVADSSVLFTGPATLPANPAATPVSGPGNRMMWYADKAAFRAGGTSGLVWDKNYIGRYSFATGLDTQASGDSSTALGSYTIASGGQSTALGAYTTASGVAATSLGYFSTASGDYALATGKSTTASGSYATAAGLQSAAAGFAATATGFATIAQGDYGTAMGYMSQANAYASTAMGYSSYATEYYAVAMGNTSTATGRSSFAAGDHAAASGNTATALGYYTTASGGNATAMGNFTTASGTGSVAIGNHTTASGDGAIALGSYVSTDGFNGSCIIGDASNTAVMTCFRPNEFRARFSGGYAFYTSSASPAGVYMLSGANAWSSISDSTKKENYIKTDGEYVLGCISKMRLGSWNYKFQNAQQFRHYGPMAQEFYRAFGNDGIGKIGCDTLINSADMDGVLMIGLQALEKRSATLSVENEGLKAANILLQQQFSQLQQQFTDKITLLENRLNEMAVAKEQQSTSKN